jgi:nicotinamidase-related amidase
MADALLIDRKRSALLVMDYQTTIVQMVPAADRAGALLERVAALLAAARGAGVRVIHSVIGFREGYPEAHPRNARLATLIKPRGLFQPGSPGREPHPAVAPAPGEIVIERHRTNAFLGTDLDMILRANDIDTLILTGIATSGVVLSTVRHGADADYRVIVVDDACADGDEEVHRVLMTKVFARQATVVATAGLLESLG